MSDEPLIDDTELDVFDRDTSGGNMKEAITIKAYDSANGPVYKVTKLVNRLEPHLYKLITHKEVEDLLIEARRGKLTVTIT